MYKKKITLQKQNGSFAYKLLTLQYFKSKGDIRKKKELPQRLQLFFKAETKAFIFNKRLLWIILLFCKAIPTV